jgi:hypothetical protein
MTDNNVWDAVHQPQGRSKSDTSRIAEDNSCTAGTGQCLAEKAGPGALTINELNRYLSVMNEWAP